MKRSSITILASVCVLVVASIACGAVTSNTEEPPPAASLAPAAQAAPSEAPEPTSPAEPTADGGPVHSVDQVTVSMKGDTVCFRGIITKFDQSRQLGTRYSFSDKSGSVFVYSVKYEIIDPNTGKTIAPGTCVEIVGPLRVEAERPAVFLDPIMDDDSGDSGYFYFYDDSSRPASNLSHLQIGCSRSRRSRGQWPRLFCNSAVMCPQARVSTISHRGGPMPSKGRILHVEDNADNRHLVRRVLEAEGYEVIEAANGTQALDFLEVRRPWTWRCWTSTCRISTATHWRRASAPRPSSPVCRSWR